MIILGYIIKFIEKLELVSIVILDSYKDVYIMQKPYLSNARAIQSHARMHVHIYTGGAHRDALTSVEGRAHYESLIVSCVYTDAIKRGAFGFAASSRARIYRCMHMYRARARAAFLASSASQRYYQFVSGISHRYSR